jgi:hypothetical protein
MLRCLPSSESAARTRISAALIALVTASRARSAREEPFRSRPPSPTAAAQHFVLAAVQHQIARIIVKTAQRHAAKPAERALVTIE